MEPDDSAAPDKQAHTPTPMERIMGILRYALLPLAAVVLVATMIIFLPTLGNSSRAAEDGQSQSPHNIVPDSTGSIRPDGATASTTPSTPPAPAAFPMPTPSGSGEAAGESASLPSPDSVTPIRITVPAAGIDVPVLPLTPTAGELASQSIVPPISDDGYWLTSYGAPGAGSTDTTYITGHSWEGRDAPFDLFSTNVKPGDTVVLDTLGGPLTYVVDAITTHDKNSLKNSDIWDIKPHRLVIISCFTEDPWGKNVVVTASPAG